MSDKPSGEPYRAASALPLVRRTAVAAGCFAGLVSLFHHVPVSIAALRGGAAFLAVLLVGRLGLAALARSLAADGRAEGREQRP
jgi:hypothetical protein